MGDVSADSTRTGHSLTLTNRTKLFKHRFSNVFLNLSFVSFALENSFLNLSLEIERFPELDQYWLWLVLVEQTQDSVSWRAR